MTQEEIVRKFEATMFDYERHENFEMIYNDGTWEQIENAIKQSTHNFKDDEILREVVKQVVNGINWNCRVIYSLDTNDGSVNVIGYESDDGSFIRDSSFKNPYPISKILSYL